VAAASLALVLHRLPTERLVAGLQDSLRGLGVAGPLVLGAVYLVAVLLFVPGSVLTIAAGALYGLWTGTLIVTFAANASAALSFLIARYVARERVERAARAHPRFAAVERAVTDGGWKMVALLRLSPLVPFTVGNYLFGLTGVRFVPYSLASFAGMLPWTAVFAYIGHVGAEGLRPRASERTPAQWVLLLVGLAATLVTAVWLTGLARRQLASHGRGAQSASRRARSRRSWWPSAAWLSLALASVGAAVAATVLDDRGSGP
jgi:uncharacterized membrane protein YdjX (TVP38/TMEM64 family)